MKAKLLIEVPISDNETLAKNTEVEIVDGHCGTDFALKDDCVGIGLLQEELGRLIFMPKCNIFCFHSKELNIFPLSIPKNKRLEMIMIIPIKPE